MLKVNKTFIILVSLTLGLIGILLLSPPDRPVNTHDHSKISTQVSEPVIAIGNLGGYPVNLPRGQIHLLEYDDSPGFDPKKIRDYNPPPRSYDSIIESFGYYVRYSTGEIMDSSKYSKREFEQEKHDPEKKWVSVGVSSGRHYREEGYLNTLLKFATQSSSANKNEVDVFQYFYISEKYFGLDTYAQINIDPDTGRSFRETDYYLSQDLFIFQNGTNTETYIKCYNHAKWLKRCEHFFDIDTDMAINVRVMYPRENLKDWREIEEVVKRSVESFKI